MRYINVYTQFFITLYAAFFFSSFFSSLMFVSIHKSAFCDEKKIQQYQQLCLDGIFKAITTFHICHCDVRARVCAFICFNSKQLIISFQSVAFTVSSMTKKKPRQWATQYTWCAQICDFGICVCVFTYKSNVLLIRADMIRAAICPWLVIHSMQIQLSKPN